jgi:hypothetical protein
VSWHLVVAEGCQRSSREGGNVSEFVVLEAAPKDLLEERSCQVVNVECMD